MSFINCVEQSFVKNEYISINKVSKISLIFGIALAAIGLILSCCSAFLIFASFPIVVLFLALTLISLIISSLSVVLFLRSSFIEKKYISIFLGNKERSKLISFLKEKSFYQKEIKEKELSISFLEKEIQKIPLIYEIKTPWQQETFLVLQDQIENLKGLISKKEQELCDLNKLLRDSILTYEISGIDAKTSKMGNNFLEFDLDCLDLYLSYLVKETKVLNCQKKFLEEILSDVSSNLSKKRIQKYECQKKIETLNRSINLLKHQLGLFKEKICVETQTIEEEKRNLCV